jgi:hypothetical protein
MIQKRIIVTQPVLLQRSLCNVQPDHDSLNDTEDAIGLEEQDEIRYAYLTGATVLLLVSTPSSSGSLTFRRYFLSRSAQLCDTDALPKTSMLFSDSTHVLLQAPDLR